MLPFLKQNFIEVSSINNLILVSDVQHSGSAVTCIIRSSPPSSEVTSTDGDFKLEINFAAALVSFYCLHGTLGSKCSTNVQ